jgi:addiction module HigA family antidote
MPTKSASKTITRGSNWLGPAIPPGEILLEEYLKPMGIGQVEAARRLGISLNRLNEIVLGKRGITADTALRLVPRRRLHRSTICLSKLQWISSRRGTRSSVLRRATALGTSGCSVRLRVADSRPESDLDLLFEMDADRSLLDLVAC